MRARDNWIRCINIVLQYSGTQYTPEMKSVLTAMTLTRCKNSAMHKAWVKNMMFSHDGQFLLTSRYASVSELVTIRSVLRVSWDRTCRITSVKVRDLHWDQICKIPSMLMASIEA